MGISVHFNGSALRTHRNLILADRAMGVALERLSSGTRLRNAGDDPSAAPMLEPFRASEPLTLGVELELQLVNSYDYDLSSSANTLIDHFRKDDGNGAEIMIATEAAAEATEAPAAVSGGVLSIGQGSGGSTNAYLVIGAP